MPSVGITGGIATGKSALCAELRRLLPEAMFFDADVAARELTARDPEVQGLLRAAYGPEKTMAPSWARFKSPAAE